MNSSTLALKCNLVSHQINTLVLLITRNSIVSGKENEIDNCAKNEDEIRYTSRSASLSLSLVCTHQECNIDDKAMKTTQ